MTPNDATENEDEDWVVVISFSVWPAQGIEADARSYRAGTARQAAEKCACDDYDPARAVYAYHVLDSVTGRRWEITVGVVPQPSFVAVEAREIPMEPAAHVLWGGHVLCEDKRLRGVPGTWPEGQRWTALADLRDDVTPPVDGCQACWAKAPGIVAGILKMTGNAT